MKIRLLPCLLLLVTAPLVWAQNSEGPKVIAQGEFLGKTIPLRDMPTVTPLRDSEVENLRIVPNSLKPNPKVNENALPLDGDPLRQEVIEYGDGRNLEQNFIGASINEGQAIPPDPTGAVGPNHYVHAVNVVVKIFDKVGNLLAGPTSLGQFLGSGNNNGDPIVLYDQLADRFFVSQFRVSDDALIVGVSETPDPTGSYFVYSFPLDDFPDYPHYSVWHDGYYLTANKFTGNTTYVLERDAILSGDPSPQIIGFNLPGVIRNPNTVFSPEPANLVGTDFDPNAPGYIVYLQDDGWNGVTFDHLKVWEIDVDYNNPSNSTISSPLLIATTPFEATFRPFGTGDLNQPGTSQRIDIIQGVISYAANYRRFTNHNSWVITFNVDVDGQNTSGIRWIELRNDATNDWSIFQEGTYAPADGESRFMGSAAMDEEGNIGVAFNLGSANTRVGIRYTGRYADDPLGVMTFPETTIIDGNGVQTNTNRFGDYSHLTMDPDGLTFWNTSEYFAFNNSWRSRISSFKLESLLTADVGVVNFISPTDGDLSDSETVEVTVFNFGNNPQSNFDIELYVDGSLVATETFTGTLAPQSGGTYTFNQTVDLSNPQQTYELEARTALNGDQAPENDNFVTTVNNTTLSTGDLEFSQGDFLVYPLSSKTYAISFVPKSDYGDLEYQIYNTIGQKLYSGTLENIGSEYTAEVNMASANTGVYFVKVTNGSNAATKRIIIE
jgi:hypothetical protein